MCENWHSQLCNGMSALVVCISLVFVTNTSVFLSWAFISHLMWTGTVQVFDNAQSHAGGGEWKMHDIAIDVIERCRCHLWIMTLHRGLHSGGSAKCMKWNWSLKSRDIVPLLCSLHIQRPEMLLCKFKPVIIQAQGPPFPGIIAGLGGPIIQPRPGGPYHPTRAWGALSSISHSRPILYPSNNYTRYMTLQSNGWGDRSLISEKRVLSSTLREMAWIH